MEWSKKFLPKALSKTREILVVSNEEGGGSSVIIVSTSETADQPEF